MYTNVYRAVGEGAAWEITGYVTAVPANDPGAPLSELEIAGVDIDPKRPNIKGICPWCGGQVLAGISLRDGAKRVLLHSDPQCETFFAISLRNPAEVIRRMRVSGVKLTPVYEGT